MPTALEMLAAKFRPQPEQLFTSMVPPEELANDLYNAQAMQATAQQVPLYPERGVTAAQESGTQEQQNNGQKADGYDEKTRFMAMLRAQEKEDEAKLKEYLDSQKSGLQQLTDIAKLRAQQPTQFDLSPLAALSDSLTPGGKLLQGYQRPQGQEANAQTAFEQLNQIQNQRNALTKLAEGGNKAANNYLRAMMAMNKDQGTQGRSDRAFLEKASEEIDNTINKDIFREGNDNSLTNIEDAYKQMEDAFTTGDGVAVSAAMGAFARIISKEKGVLAEGDIERVQPKTIGKVRAEWEKWATDNPGVPLPDSYVKPYRELVEKSKKALAKQRLAELDRREKEKSRRPGYGALFNEGGYGKESFKGARQRLEGLYGKAETKQTATNPNTGEVVEFVDGKWVPVK